MAGLGLVNLLFQDLTWKLESQDDSFVVEGQFTTTDLVENISAEYQEFKSLGRAQPILSFKNNANTKMSFTAVFRARHNGLFGPLTPGFGSDVIDNHLERIKSLPVPTKDLGRPRIFNFVLGQSVQFPCVVESVGGIAYERLRPLTGDHRAFKARISLRYYEPYDPSLSRNAPAESLIIPFFENESYESLTQRIYGTPHLGEALRRRNPELTSPKAGDFVHVPPASVLASEKSVTPQSRTLDDSNDSTLRRRQYIAKRNAKSYRSHTLSPEWNKVG